ncbi:MAG: isochorismatase family protein [Magnetococcales bacterium]|nr:isochorismatase family protein [Magnetococcales bacterium]
MKSRRAVLVVDVQNDFCTGGILAARGTTTLIAHLNKFLAGLDESLPVILTRDWHPPQHDSFSDYGGPWPAHCIQGTPGAAFACNFEIPSRALIVNKGTKPGSMGYSPFELREFINTIESMKIKELGVCGIATEYCVKNTVLDALKLDFKVEVLTDMISPIEATPGDSELALETMFSAGAKKSTGAEWSGYI